MTERITAPHVHMELLKHLQRHEDRIDKKIHNHHIILFGPDGDKGMCAEIKAIDKRVGDLEKTNQKIDKLTWAVITAIVIQLVMAGLQSV